MREDTAMKRKPKKPKHRNPIAMALIVGKYKNKVFADKRKKLKAGYKKHKGRNDQQGE